jgi:hypothetical protein
MRLCLTLRNSTRFLPNETSESLRSRFGALFGTIKLPNFSVTYLPLLWFIHEDSVGPAELLVVCFGTPATAS